MTKQSENNGNNSGKRTTLWKFLALLLTIMGLICFLVGWSITESRSAVVCTSQIRIEFETYRAAQMELNKAIQSTQLEFRADLREIKADIKELLKRRE